MTTFEEVRIANLEKRRALLIKQYEAVSEKNLEETNPATQVVLDQQYQNIEQQIEDVDADIKELKQKIVSSTSSGLSSVRPQREHLDYRRKLAALDFGEAARLVQTLLEIPPDFQARAALLLLQNSKEMAGEWCLTRLRSLLEEDTSDFKSYPVVYTLTDNQDARSLLTRLAVHLDAPSPPEETSLEALQPCAQEIISRLIGSLQTGTVVFIEFKDWDYVLKQPTFWPWFLDTFWNPLIDALIIAAKSCPQIRIFIIFVSGSALPQQALASVLCDCSNLTAYLQQSMIARHLIDLPLRKWRLQEIQSWLDKHYSLFETGMKSEKVATNIYQLSSDGTPGVVCEQLLRYFDEKGRP